MGKRGELPSIAGLATLFGIRPLKKFGQNFIYDESLCDKIVRASGLQEGEVVVEIGPGPAGLTRSILKASPELLHAIEMDSRCVPLLEEIKKHYPALHIILQDALKISIADLGAGKPVRVISNLPYNVGTKLILNWFRELDNIKSITVMLQREVADRITAAPNSKSYGRLSIISQLCCDAAKCFDVSPKAFYPPPKVWSSIVRLVPKKDRPNGDIISLVEEITNQAFSGRRKMLKASLKNLQKNHNIELAAMFHTLSIDPTLRAENLTPRQYLAIAEYLLPSLAI